MTQVENAKIARKRFLGRDAICTIWHELLKPCHSQLARLPNGRTSTGVQQQRLAHSFLFSFFVSATKGRSFTKAHLSASPNSEGTSTRTDRTIRNCSLATTKGQPWHHRTGPAVRLLFWGKGRLDTKVVDPVRSKAGFSGE